MGKDSFIFYGDWYRIAQQIPDAHRRAAFYEAVLTYALQGEVPTLPQELGLIFEMIKMQIDRANSNYANICASRQEAGRKGAEARWGSTKSNDGKMAKMANATFANGKMAKMASDGKHGYNDNDNVNENDFIDLSEKSSKSAPKTSKVEQLEKRKQEFYESLLPFKEQYPAGLLSQFFEYWSEPNKSNTKMRFETEKTWSLPLRLRRWAANEKIR